MKYEKMDLYRFGIDWLNGVLPISDVSTFFEVLGSFSSKLRFERWQKADTGMYNYKFRFLLDGKATIQIAYNPIDTLNYPFAADMKCNNPGIFVSISGDGLRYLHSIGGELTAFRKLFYYLSCNNFKATRFDTYCDIFDKDNSVVPVLTAAIQNFMWPKFQEPNVVTGFHRQNKNFQVIMLQDLDGSVCYNTVLGNHSSEGGMFRCYNKRLELAEGRLSDVAQSFYASVPDTGYWYRLEYVLKKEKAAQAFNALMVSVRENGGVFTFEDIFFSAANRLFDVVNMTMPASHMADNRRHSVWSEFYDQFAETIHFVEFKPLPYVNQTVERLHNLMLRNSGYLYAQLQLLDLLPDLRRRIYSEGQEKFSSNKKYNLLRDEIFDYSSEGFCFTA